MKSIRIFLLLIIGIFLIIAIASLISAGYSNKCLSYGESVPSNEKPRYTCHFDMCQVCVDGNNFPTHPGYCKKVEPCVTKSPECLENTPPVLNVFSPKNNEIYSSKKVYYNLSSDKLVTFYYIDNINGRGRWSKLTSRTRTYNKGITFKDGLNNITIKAVDNCGDYSEKIIIFYVDSKKPKFEKIISKNLKSFYFELNEENPRSLSFIFGNNENGYSNYDFDTSKCTSKTNSKKICEFNITNYLQLFSKYSNQDISYYFVLKDVSLNNATSKPMRYHVDLTNPVIKNPESVFSIDGGRVEFYIEVLEDTFDKITYIDNLDNIPREKTLCTKLTDGHCLKKVTFNPGEHNIIIKVSDKSGNYATQEINFEID
jgi:hypothetical protein